ncbi:MAG: hypothetical protein KGJ35_03895, partial [Patescibacteria group bacterium]|nr:hypothetical protein [Patescibacteria group bacterium]
MDILSPFNVYSIRDTDLVLDAPAKGKDYSLKIRDLPADDKPRERLLNEGPENLSLRELMAIVFVSGTTKEDVLGMSSRIIREYGEHSILEQKDPSRLSAELDIPIVKSCQIVAVGEIGRRLYNKNPAGFVFVRNG